MKTRNCVSLLLAAVALIGLSVPAPAFAQMKHKSMNGHGEGCQMMEQGGMGKMGDMMGMCVEHADKMGLSDDQVAKMKPLHRDMQKKNVRFEADRKIAEIELAEIMEVKNFDLDKAGSAVRKIADIKTAHHLGMLAAMKEMRSNLTDKQFTDMKKMMMSKKMVGKKPAGKHHRKHK